MLYDRTRSSDTRTQRKVHAKAASPHTPRTEPKTTPRSHRTPLSKFISLAT